MVKFECREPPVSKGRRRALGCMVGMVSMIAGVGAGESKVMNDQLARAAGKLLAAHCRHVGATPRAFDERGFAGFPSYRMRFDPAGGRLLVIAHVSRLPTRRLTAEARNNVVRMISTLNDPKIGGMFEHAGGRFDFDEETQAFVLIREFPVMETSSDDLNAEVDRLLEVTAVWTIRWLFRVSKIMHGHEAAPTLPVGLGDPDP